MRRIAVLLLLVAACSSKSRMKHVTLVEGRGTESLVIGTTTLKQAAKTLGSSEDNQSTSGRTAELEAPPLRLSFITPEGGGEPMLWSVLTFQKGNPNMPNWEGKTGRGLALLDPVEKMRTLYGKPDAESVGSPWRVYYYTSGVIFASEQATQVSGYKGSATGELITRIAVTRPFEILEAGSKVEAGQRVYSTAPKTTLPELPF